MKAHDGITGISLKRMEWEKESLKNELLKKLGVSQEQARLSLLRLHWSEIAGPLGQHTRPERLDNGILYVAVSHPAYASELKLHQRALLQALARKNLAVERIKHLLKGDPG